MENQKKKPKWSPSDAEKLRLCPRQFYYAKVLGYKQFPEPSFLGLGNAYDKLFEFYDIEGDKAKKRIPELFKDEHEAAEAEIIFDEFVIVNKQEPLPPWEYEGKPGNQVGFGDDLGDIISTGYMDKVSYRVADKEPIVVERKTTSEAIEDNSEYWKKLPLDTQIRSYVTHWRLAGFQAGWVCYEVVRKINTKYWSKITKKKTIPIEKYREMLAVMPRDKKLVSRRWIFIDMEASHEFIAEHNQSWSAFQQMAQTSKVLDSEGQPPEWAYPKHTQACNAYGGCPFRPVCEREGTLEQMTTLTREKGKFSEFIPETEK